jgi:hypothetical protein
MHTTTIIVEVLVIGYTSLLWIVPVLLAHCDLGLCDLLVQAEEYKEWAPVVAVLLTAVAYQIGWLLDYFTYLFFYYVGITRKPRGDQMPDRKFWGFYFIGMGRNRKREWIPDGEFWNYYNIVCQEGSRAIHETLRTDLSVIRFARSGIVNFLLIGVTFLSLLNSWALLGICLAISFGCLLALGKRWGHYYEKIRISYNRLRAQAALDE